MAIGLALDFSRSLLNGTELSRLGCWCSSDPRGDQKGNGDLIFPTEWDTQETSAERPGQFSDPAALQSRPDREGSIEEVAALRELLRRFIHDLISGRSIEVMVQDGKTQSCRLQLSHNLQHFELEAEGSRHEIPIKNVKDMCPGTLVSGVAGNTAPLPLDDLCSTIVLRNNECVTFRLASLQERDELTKGVKMLTLALNQ